MIERRVPEWFRDDSLVKTVDDEVSFIEINSYYDWLRTYVKQPIQIWREIKDLDPLDAQINVRLHAEPEYPLREINLYEDCLGDGTDDILFTKTYRKYDKVTEDLIEFTSEPTLERCYVEVKYHCLNGSIIVGFPQDANATDEAFLPNEFLDKHAKELGLFRRTYKTTIPDTDLPNTYPMGYPYSVEQDYYLEKRLLNEYPWRNDKTPRVILKDENGLDAILIRSIKKEASNIEIRVLHNSIVDISLDNELHPTEHYEYYDFDDLINKINTKSKNIRAEKLYKKNNIISLPLYSTLEKTHIYDESTIGTEIDVTTTKLVVGNYNIRTEGIYHEYGLLKSEIYQYLGVIPEIKNMADYCLIWNRKIWNSFLWGGDDYLPGVFRVEIPYSEIPSNFELLDNDDLQRIIDKCKALGTKGFAVYTQDAETINESSTVDISCEQGCEIELDPSFAYSYVTDSIRYNLSQAIISSTSIDEIITLNTLLLATTSIQVESLINSLIIDTDTDMGKTSRSDGLLISGTSTSADIEIDLSAKNTGSRFATSVYNEAIAGPSYAWTSVQNALYKNSGFASAKAGSVGGSSHHLVFSGFNFDIPDDAKVTGIYVRWSSYNDAGTDHTSRRNFIYLCAGSSTSTIKNTTFNTGWKEYGFGGDRDTWGLPTSPSYFNGNNFVVKYWTDLNINHTGMFDWIKATIYYKYNGASFVTTKIGKVDVSSPFTGAWGELTHTLKESLPSGCSVLYDVFSENIDQSQANSDTDINLGTTVNKNLIQTFQLAISPLSGIEINTGTVAKIGSPSDSVVVKIYTNNNNTQGTLIASKTVDMSLWTNNSIINVPFDTVSLTAGSYIISLERSGVVDDNNYYSIRYLSSGNYSDGKLRVKNSNNSYSDVNGGLADLYFKTYYPDYQLQNQTAPIDLSSIPYQDIKIKGKLSTTNTANTPKIDKITVTRGEIQ